MQQTPLFLLEIRGSSPSYLTPLRSALHAAGHPVTPVVVDPDALDGDDASALRVLQQIRAAKQESSAVVVGVGLAASFALWMDSLDLAKPKRLRFGSQTLTLDHEWEKGPALTGVVALYPFLGFDFSLSGRPSKAEGFTQWRFEQSRGGLARFLGGQEVPQAHDHGSPRGELIRWSQLSRCLPFASVVKVLPSLKRPTVIVLDTGTRHDRVEVELCALSAKVTLMDSPAVFPQLGHVTLAAVDSLQKGAASTDG
jgi:hypothetical protein